MNEVRVHRNQQAIALVIGVVDTNAVGTANAGFVGTMDGEHSVVFLGESINQLARAIGRVVIQKHDIGF